MEPINAPHTQFEKGSFFWRLLGFQSPPSDEASEVGGNEVTISFHLGFDVTCQDITWALGENGIHHKKTRFSVSYLAQSWKYTMWGGICCNSCDFRMPGIQIVPWLFFSKALDKPNQSSWKWPNRQTAKGPFGLPQRSSVSKDRWIYETWAQIFLICRLNMLIYWTYSLMHLVSLEIKQS